MSNELVKQIKNTYKNQEYSITIEADCKAQRDIFGDSSPSNFPFGVWAHVNGIEVFRYGCYGVNSVSRAKRKAHRAAKKFIRSVL